MEEYEKATELLEPFHEVEIPKNRTYFNLNINKRKKIIKENSDKLKEKNKYYDKKKYLKMLELMKNVKNKKDNISLNLLDMNFTDIFSNVYQNKFILKNQKTNHNFLTEENLLQKRIPENLLGYIDPYDISLITNSTKKKIKLKNKSNNHLSSNQKEYFPTDISYNNNYDYDNNYYNFPTDNNIDGVDFKLISSINQEQKKITKKLQKLNPEMKNDIKIRNSERKLRPKSSLYSFPRYFYVPNTSHYKHINLKKEEIFNNIFPKKRKKTFQLFQVVYIKSTESHKKIFIIPPKFILAITKKKIS